MYKALKPLRRLLAMSQADLAQAMDTDQAQISRLESGAAGRPFEKLCAQLRTFVRRHPQAWLRVLASAQAAEVFAEYRDLLFVNGELTYDYEELWVISPLPAECQRADVRRQVGRAIHERGATICYWVADEALAEVKTMLLAMEDEDGLSPAEIAAGIRIVRAPTYLTPVPMALMDPRSDRRVGFLSPQFDYSGGVHLIVLPHTSSTRLYKRLEPIYRVLRRGVDTCHVDGFEWQLVRPEGLDHE